MTTRLDSNVRRAYVLGGAGFVGSAIAKEYARRGDEVVVVDGFLPRTGAAKSNLAGANVTLIPQRLEDLDGDALSRMAQADVIVDAMAWTSHIAALRDPAYDMALNMSSHLSLLTRLPEGCRAHIVYLGSRGQYGKNCDTPIKEGGRMLPDDIQGIHKAAADHYFRVFSKIKRLNVTSLRFPNCFGEGQKREGEDIGLIGGFIKDALAGRGIEIFGNTRCRSVVYVGDVAACAARLGDDAPNGYRELNMAGTRENLVALCARIVTLAHSGSYSVVPMPDAIRAIDMGDVPVCEDALRATGAAPTYTDLDAALDRTIQYFREACV